MSNIPKTLFKGKVPLQVKESPLAGKTVLVVDDEIELRKAIIFDLKRKSCIIFEAGNGEEALEIIKTKRIDIVLSDVRMPRGTGVDLLKKIREIHPSIPIVLLATGFADLSEAEALSIGAFGIIEKPIDREEMLALLERACSAL